MRRFQNGDKVIYRGYGESADGDRFPLVNRETVVVNSTSSINPESIMIEDVENKFAHWVDVKKLKLKKKAN